MAAIIVRNLIYEVPKKRILNNVNFTVEEGQINTHVEGRGRQLPV